MEVRAMIMTIIFLTGISITFMVLFLVDRHQKVKMQKKLIRTLLDTRKVETKTETLDCDYLNRFKAKRA